MRTKLIKPSMEHRVIDGSVLCAERGKTGLSQADFASECGYSQQYQQKLEAEGLHEITSETAEQILTVLKKYNQCLTSWWFSVYTGRKLNKEFFRRKVLWLF